MYSTMKTNWENLKSSDGDVRYQAFTFLTQATKQPN